MHKKTTLLPLSHSSQAWLRVRYRTPRHFLNSNCLCTKKTLLPRFIPNRRGSGSGFRLYVRHFLNSNCLCTKTSFTPSHSLEACSGIGTILHTPRHLHNANYLWTKPHSSQAWLGHRYQIPRHFLNSLPYS